ncbi:MAG: tetratricopeptide repeat protein [candidate division Zixibacteria bacterium]|nr:tetratricopeptide repeat protein [candidate division Zixibacteria bacterium]
MNTCPNCTTELVVDGGERCPVCNALLTPETPPPGPPADDDLRFDIQEAHGDQRELTGPPQLKSRRNELEIEDESQMMANQSSPVILPTAEESFTGFSPTPSAGPAEPVAPKSDEDLNGIKRLTAEEVSSISKSLYGNRTYMSDQDKIAALRKVDASARSVSQRSADGSDKPAAPRRTRGIAWYYKNWIQVVGESDLREQDEITIHDRQFVLRKKQFSPKMVLAIGGPLAAILLFVVGSVLTPSISGKGRIVGCVLDKYGRPPQGPATVKLPDDDLTVQTNGQGFFVTGPVKSGAHRIEVTVGNEVVSSDFATVVPNEVTTIRLRSALPPRPAQPLTQQQDLPEAPSSSATPPQTDIRPSQTTAVVTPPESPRSAVKSTSDSNAKLVLKANVDGATLKLGSKVIGAGNLAYTQLKPGRYLYMVSKTGYQSVGGSIELAAGKTATLSVELTPVATKSAARPAAPSETQHYQAGLDALGASNFATAEKEFSAALQVKPDFAAALVGRGNAKSRSGRNADAVSDYISAAELYRSSGDPNNAMKAYNQAIQADNGSAAALLGRGDIYLARGEEVAAITDFEAVIALDKRNTDAYIGLGRARLAQGNAKPALKHFKDARSLEPKNPEIYQYLMLCYFADDNMKEAKKAYDSFTEVASAAQVARIKRDSKYSAVLRAVQDK